MKLSDWPEGFAEPGVVEYIHSCMAALGATEEAAIYSRDESDNVRALVATDAALLDCSFDPEDRAKFEVHAIPWDAAPAVWIVYAGVVNPGGMEPQDTVRVSVYLDPEFHGTYMSADEQAAASDFTTKANERRRSR